MWALWEAEEGDEKLSACHVYLCSKECQKEAHFDHLPMCKAMSASHNWNPDLSVPCLMDVWPHGVKGFDLDL